MENILDLEFAYLDRSLLEQAGVDAVALVDVFRGRSSGELVQQSAKTMVRRYPVRNGEIYFKLYRAAAGSRWLPAGWSSRRALRAFQNASQLSLHGIKTAPVIALVTRDRKGVMAGSGLLTLSISPARVISRYFAESLSSDGTLSQRRDILHELARFLWDTHEKQIYPKDFKAGNILIAPVDHGAPFYLVDYDGFVFSKPVSLRRRLKNLYQIGITLKYALSGSELAFFLRSYCERKPCLSARLGVLEREIETSRSGSPRRPGGY